MTAVGPIIDEFCLLLAKSSELVLSIFDSEVLRNGAIIYKKDYNSAIEVTKACSALESVMVLSAGILAFPTDCKEKFKGILLAFIVVEGINLFRLMSLVYLRDGLSAHDFDFAHEQIWIYLLKIVILVFFIFWGFSQYIKLNREQA
jgi:exosortase/archaeosortase family protein